MVCLRRQSQPQADNVTGPHVPPSQPPRVIGIPPRNHGTRGVRADRSQQQELIRVALGSPRSQTTTRQHPDSQYLSPAHYTGSSSRPRHPISGRILAPCLLVAQSVIRSSPTSCLRFQPTGITHSSSPTVIHRLYLVRRPNPNQLEVERLSRKRKQSSPSYQSIY